MSITITNLDTTKPEKDKPEDFFIQAVCDKLNSLIDSMDFFSIRDHSIVFRSCSSNEYTVVICFVSLCLIHERKKTGHPTYTSFGFGGTPGSFEGLCEPVCERLLTQLNKYNTIDDMQVIID